MTFATKLTWTSEGLITSACDSKNGRSVEVDQTLVDEVTFGLIVIGLEVWRRMKWCHGCEKQSNYVNKQRKFI